jgi:hypothetical protein
MAEIVLLRPDQLAERERPKGRLGRRRSEERTRIIETYKDMMREAEPGYGADVLLEPGESKRVVRQNLKAAALELEKVLEFRPIKDPVRMHFRVVTPEEKAARPRRGGRPRKNPQPAAETPATPAKRTRKTQKQAE